MLARLANVSRHAVLHCASNKLTCFYGIFLCRCVFDSSLLFLLVCNEVPEHPCVSPVSNQVFERRLIEKYIAENGTDPMNGQPLSEEQLIDIKGT